MKNITPMMCLLILICACSKNEHQSVEQQPSSYDSPERILCGEKEVVNIATGQAYKKTVYCN